MRITLLTAALLGAMAGAALAEDFTGFYAGINAGYARGDSVRDGQGPGPIPGLTDAPASESGLPPSARSASETMRGRPRGNDPAR